MHYLDELPPIGFDHIDVSTLLGWLQQLSMDICGVKSVLEAQTLACEKLREETVALDNRVSAIENLEDNSHALWLLLRVPRWHSAVQLFVSLRLPTFKALL